MLGIRLVSVIRGKDPIHRINDFESIGMATAQTNLIEVAKVVREEMVRVINGRKRKRFADKDTLENAIQVEILLQTNIRLDIGIGNIPQLNTIAPYWAALNAGFTPPTINKLVERGSFSDGRPDLSQSGGTWYVGQGWKFYTFLDKKLHKTVSPFNYIDIAESLGQKLLLDIDRKIRNINRQ